MRQSQSSPPPTTYITPKFRKKLARVSQDWIKSPAAKEYREKLISSLPNDLMIDRNDT